MWVDPSQPPASGVSTLLDTHDQNLPNDSGYSLYINSSGTITWQIDGLATSNGLNSVTSSAIQTGSRVFCLCSIAPRLARFS